MLIYSVRLLCVCLCFGVFLLCLSFVDVLGYRCYRLVFL